jgi:hypothetical protein
MKEKKVPLPTFYFWGASLSTQWGHTMGSDFENFDNFENEMILILKFLPSLIFLVSSRSISSFQSLTPILFDSKPKMWHDNQSSFFLGNFKI